MASRDIVVLGASAGGLQPLQQLIASLPARMPAALFAVVHIPAYGAVQVPDLLQGAGCLKARFATDGERIERGLLLMGPADQHLIVQRDTVRLSRGPRENLWRPAIDVLFRSAAVAHGSRVIGVLLSGQLDDGTAGLSAIERCGGVPLVQDPDEAAFPSMPASALRNVEGARALPVREIGPAIVRLLEEPAVSAAPAPDDLRVEVEVAAAARSTRLSGTPGGPGPNACPECGSPLRVLPDAMLRFRQHTRCDIESSLWTAIRLLQQRANLDRALAHRESERGRAKSAEQFADRAAEAEGHASTLRDLLRQLFE